MTGLVVCVAVLVLASAFGVVRTVLGGRLRTRARDGAVCLSAAELGADLGGRVTLLQFSTAFCAPCRATRRLLAEVVATVPGSAHVEIDAEQRPELVKRLGILRTPTVLVLDSAGRVVGRMSGQPGRADVTAGVDRAIAAPAAGSGHTTAV